MTLDLTGPQARFAATLTHACTIDTLDVPADRMLDEVTGVLAAPTSSQLYGGACLVRRETGTRKVEGGAEIDVVNFVCLLPASAPAIPLGSSVTVTAGPLVGSSFVVTTYDVGPENFAKRVVGEIPAAALREL